MIRRIFDWIVQSLCFVPKVALNGCIVSTVPILGLNIKNEFGSEVEQLISSLTPMSFYFKYALFALPIFSLVSHFKVWVDKKPKFKLTNSFYVNYLNRTLVWWRIGPLRVLISLVNRVSAVLSETFLGLVTAFLGIYIAYIIKMLFLDSGYCVYDKEQLWQYIIPTVTLTLLAAMTSSNIEVSKSVRRTLIVQKGER